MSALGAGTLEQRVAALEQAIAGLQGSEALNPNYLTLTPAGLVGANFTGVINALGLTLPAYQAGGAPTPAGNAIEWIRSDGVMIAQLGAFAAIGVIDDFQITLPLPLGDTVTQLTISVGNLAQVLLDSFGNSFWAQWTNSLPTRIAAGVTTFTGNGTNTVNLGTISQTNPFSFALFGVVAGPNPSGANGAWTGDVSCTSISGVNFQLVAHNRDGTFTNTGQYAVNWFAWGE